LSIGEDQRIGTPIFCAWCCKVTAAKEHACAAAHEKYAQREHLTPALLKKKNRTLIGRQPNRGDRGPPYLSRSVPFLQPQ
jgi:hypothetical protein